MFSGKETIRIKSELVICSGITPQHFLEKIEFSSLKEEKNRALRKDKFSVFPYRYR